MSSLKVTCNDIKKSHLNYTLNYGMFHNAQLEHSSKYCLLKLPFKSNYKVSF